MQNLKKNWLAVCKMTWATWRILTQALKSLKNLHFNGLLLTKVYNVWAKKYRGVMFDGTDIDAKFSKNWQVLPKMAWRIWQIFTSWKIAIPF